MQHIIPEKERTQYLNVASSVIIAYNRRNDPTYGATYFHEKSIRPRWKNVIRTVRIGNHIFFKSK